MKLILLRHGQSIWNLENRFTGWTDIDLSEEGIKEAENAGMLLKDANITFDIAYTSYLKRANHTLDIVLDKMNVSVPIYDTWRLNERHYGALQGLNKEETKEKYGEEQVRLWRRSVDVRPPALSKEDERYPGNDTKYKDLKETELPLTENLNDTINRVLPYYEEVIKPSLKDKNVIVVAHGNSLRALVRYLDNLSSEEVVALEIPTGKPLIYEMDETLHPIRHYYL